ncbi:MAG: cupin domain-containing protein [bacterium]
MNEWWKAMGRGPIPPGALATAAVVLVAVRFAPHKPEVSPPTFYETVGALDHRTEALVSEVVARHESASVHHLRTTADVPAHFHRIHDETVVILSGHGRIRLDQEWRELRPGLVVAVPRGTVHEVEVLDGAIEAISVFSPPFDGVDRIFLDE